MTPQEKAKELYLKYYPYVNDYSYPEPAAKELTMITVDEMLNNAGFIWGGRDTETGMTARDQYRKYWQEVKDEINKL